MERWEPLVREPKATIATGWTDSIILDRAVRTFSGVTRGAEVSGRVCGAVVTVDSAVSIPQRRGDLKGAGKAVNIVTDEFVRRKRWCGPER